MNIKVRVERTENNKINNNQLDRVTNVTNERIDYTEMYH